MKSHSTIHLLTALVVVSTCCVSCDFNVTSVPNGGSNPSGGVNDGGDPSRPNPFAGALSARVRNESSSRVDVTMRFIREDSVVHLAFVRVPPSTITSVASPEMVEMVELSGVDEAGRALDAAHFRYGIDFDERTPAEYIVVDRNAPPTPGDGSIGALWLSLLEPSVDVNVALGSSLRVRWDDGGMGPAGLVRLFLRPEGVTTASAMRVMSPAIGASLDGINDEFALLVQDVSPGRYELIAELLDGDRSVFAVAPGVVTIRLAAGNKAPKISIAKPTEPVELRADEKLHVAWSDRDDDDNATIVFSLERPHTAVAAGGSFIISPPIAENPDGLSADSATLSLEGVLPGLYDLVATIDDGALRGVDRVEGLVRVLPSPVNDPPRLVILVPSRDTDVAPGSTVLVRWIDGDDNDNARISILIDSNWSRVGLSGGERMLISGLSEDDDGSRGSATLTIPVGLTAGKYRLIGVITDGVTQVITRAPGFLLIEGDPAVVVSDGGSGSSGGAPPGNDDEGNAAGDDPGKDDPSGGGSGGGGSGGSSEPNDDGATGDDSDPVGDGGSNDNGGDPHDDGDPGDAGGGDDGATGDDPNDDSGTGDDSGSDPGTDDPNEDDSGTGEDDGSGDHSGDDSGDDSGDQGSDDSGTGAGGHDRPDVVVVHPSARVPQERATVPVSDLVYEIGLIPTAPDIPANLTLTNVPYGGSTRVELPPAASWRATSHDPMMQLRIPLSEIPNQAWPRSFDLILTYVIDGEEQVFVWPRPIQIPQLVEVVFAEFEGRCQNRPAMWLGANRFTGLSIGWFGGGISANVGRARVSFWLSRDGVLPDQGREDAEHRLVFAGLGRPNDFAVSQIDLFTVVMGGLSTTDGRDLARPAAGDSNGVVRREALLPGLYSVVVEVDYGEFGRVVFRPEVDAIDVCPTAIDWALSN